LQNPSLNPNIKNIKMLKKHFFINLLILIFFSLQLNCQQPSIKQDQNLNNLALITVPVADLTGAPVNLSKQIPICPVNANDGTFSCPRIHQALFNEIIKIININSNQALIETINCFYDIKNKNIKTKRSPRFWINNKNYKILKNIKNLNFIPKPISYQKLNLNNFSNNIITLVKPYYSPKLKMKFSIGTRFAIKNFNNKENTYLISIYNPKTDNFITEQVNKNLFINNKNLISKNLAYKRKLFIKLLKSWANLNKNLFIPYVWGGCSLVNPYNKDINYKFLEKNITLKTKKLNYYEYINNNKINKKQPISGFDCAGLILRAAQLAGLEYYYKNTTTILNNLKLVNNINQLKSGDLIWLPGHIMAISDLDKNLAIEARHYSHGFGKVQEINLNKVFKNINNKQDLYKAYITQKKLDRLDINNQPVQKVQIKLLSII